MAALESCRVNLSVKLHAVRQEIKALGAKMGELIAQAEKYDLAHAAMVWARDRCLEEMKVAAKGMFPKG